MMPEVISEHTFHDNLIRGICFASGMEDFSSDIHFDIDHILEWVNCSTQPGDSLFSVSKATLKFHDVSDLVINLSLEKTNHSQFSSLTSGIYILDILKEKIESSLSNTGNHYYKWKIITTDKGCTIQFGAASMSLELFGTPKIVNRQYLTNDERIQ